MTMLAVLDLPLFVKGVLTVVMGFILFIGSVYILLAAVFGKRMGYLVLATAFFGWLAMLSLVWWFGYLFQGPGTERANLGPKGTVAHWQAVEGGFGAASDRYPVAAKYPGAPWRAPSEEESGEVEGTAVAVQEFLANQANERENIEPIHLVPAHAGGTLEDEAEELEARLEEESQTLFIPEDFVVDRDSIKYATADDGETRLAMARAYYVGGGPAYTVVAAFDKGNEFLPAQIFFVGSIIGLLTHLPFLDRAERKRKDILTGGTAPVWRGPA